MPNTPAEEEPPKEEPGTATPPEGADAQAHDSPRGHGGKAFLEHLEDSMNEHETLGRLLAESQRQCRESRTEELPEDLPGRLDKGDPPRRRSCPDP